MRALVLHGPGDLQYEHVPDPELPGPDAAILQISHTAICGSDLHLFHGLAAGFPLRVGHECIGEVIEVGSAVRRIRVGDRVMVAAVIGCDSCAPCRGGNVIGCTEGGPRVFGVTADLSGAQAELMAVPAADTSLALVPEGVSSEQAVLLTDILPTGWMGAELADVRPGGTVAVIGLGPVGLAAVMAAVVKGAATVYAVDGVAERRDRAAALGAIPVEPGPHAGAKTILERTDGRGVHSVVEAVGRRSTIHDAIRAARVGGSIGIVGASHEMSMPFPMAQLFLKNLTIRSGLCPVAGTWPQLVPLVASGRMNPEAMISHRLPLSDGPNAYGMFDRREADVMKIVMDPAG
jgi:2-desacetyl-2-hydroxyethyl bacteriochlorophyllide A dehydrogenase